MAKLTGTASQAQAKNAGDNDDTMMKMVRLTVYLCRPLFIQSGAAYMGEGEISIPATRQRKPVIISDILVIVAALVLFLITTGEAWSIHTTSAIKRPEGVKMSNAEASAPVINGAATMERLHFVYGTLMSPEVLTELIGRVPPLIPGKLKGYKRYRVPDQVYPGILPDEEEGSVVDGLLVQDLNEKDIAVFDAFEGDDYVKTPVEVEVDDGNGRRHMVAACVYVWIPVPGSPLVEPWSYEESFRPNLAKYLIMSKEFRDSLVHLPR